ncbi:putative methanogenesis marker protein 1 [Thermoplasmatales archaeon BRNA1]|nr:putative methanogenesis marker protein 1 [Thermoplasmatales archaeon BRNA1]
MLELNRCPKVSKETGIRVMPTGETLARIRPLMERAGMEKPRDITGLDRLGIPVFSVDRPATREGEKNHFYNGKGPTPEQAEASGIMEAMERYAAEPREDDEIAYGTYEQASDIGLTVNPESLILPMPHRGAWMGQQIAWCEGYEMFRGCPVWVPACAVYHVYKPDEDFQLFRSHTNGIAAGNTMEEAILHALLEDIERDAWSIAEYNETANADVIIGDENSVPGKLLKKFRDAGVEVHLKDITTDIGITTIGAAADDVETKDPEMLTIGVGTHLDPQIACIRALTEVAQSRATHKDGTKINAQLVKKNLELGYEGVKKQNPLWYRKSNKSKLLEDMPNLATDYVLDDIEVVLQHLMDAGFDMVVCNDLTRPETGVPVVRMTVPGLEVFTMDPEREGARLVGMWPPRYV